MELKLDSVTLPGMKEYLQSHLQTRKEVFFKMEGYAKRTGASIVGPEIGNLLSFLTKITNANEILEMGSSIGYSTLWFADALGDNGKVTYTDYSKENAKIAKYFLEEEKLEKKVNIYTGDALQFAEKSIQEYDIVLIDLDKELYLDALHKVMNKVRPGGLIVADNTLWGGRVRWNLDDERTKVINAYNKFTSESDRLHTCIIPIRDGVTLSIKKKPTLKI